ncbi:MAG TPA: tetratricopeptide repeat protein [Dongiaceae bacterium]|nr:tetratricopeptide repeat protein [Dongiaceae bacterium]
MALTDFSGIVRNLTQSAEERAVARALGHFSKGQIDKAIAVLKEALANSPEDPGVLLELARMLATAQRPLEGVEHLRTLLRKEPRAATRVGEAIEELRARHAPVGPLYDALAEHHLRQEGMSQALAILDRLRPEDLRAVLPRYLQKWEQWRRGNAAVRLTRTILLPALHLGLLHEALKDLARAIDLYQDILRTNPEEAGRLLPRLEALAARDFQNSTLRLAIAGMLLGAGKSAEAAKHFGLAIETDARSGREVAQRITSHFTTAGDDAELRWVMVQALIAGRDPDGAIEALRPLVAAGTRLDDAIGVLQPLATPEKSGAARRLLALAFSRRGQPHQALGPLLQVAEEEGLRSVEEPLKALVEEHPDVLRAWQMLADIHLEAGRTADALAAIQKARALAPRETSALLPRLTRLMARDRSSADAHLMLAEFLRDSGEAERAVVVLRHLVREHPAEARRATERLLLLADSPAAPRARLGVAEAALAIGRPADALPQVEALAAEHPELTVEFLHLVSALAPAAPGLAPRLVTLLESLEPRSPVPLAVHFARGEALFHLGALPAAAASFREVLQSAPERAAEVRLALEKFDRADPKATEARYLLASLHVEQRDHEAALKELTRPGPTHADLLKSVIKKYESLIVEQPEDMAARAAFLKALILARDFDRVIEVARDTLKRKDDASTAGVSLAMADALAEKGDLDGAVRRYFTATRRDPALALESIARLKRLIEVQGQHPFGCLALGKLLAQQGRAAEAVESLRAARAGDPALHDSVITELENLTRACPAEAPPGLALIALHYDAGQHERAVQVIAGHLDAHPASAQRLAAHLDRILEHQPGHPLAHYELGRALQVLGAHARAADRFAAAARLDAAIGPLALRRLQELLIADPSCTGAWLACAEVLAGRGQSLQAAERLAEAIARDASQAGALLDRIESLYRAHPGEAPMALIYAEACARAGQPDRAARAYGEAAAGDLESVPAAMTGLDGLIASNPRLAECWWQRARARLRLSQNEAALADLAEAARLAPRLLPEVLRVTEELSAERPGWPECTLLLADLMDAAGRGADGEAILEKRLPAAGKRAVRLQILLRLAQGAAGRGDDATARRRLGEAAGLATDRNEFLGRVHALQIKMLRRRIGAAHALLISDAPAARAAGTAAARAVTLTGAVRAAIDLGEAAEAEAILERAGERLIPEAERRALRAEVAILRGDYLRASEQLRPAGPSPLLAFGAARAGDRTLAIQTLEALVARGAAPGARAALEKIYRDLVAADLLGGSRRLQAETTPHFGEGARA